jgi:23S rRNA pseudouridine1911/1915/1917 synthase
MRTGVDNLQVVYEDNHLIVINKRPGDIVQGDKTGDLPLSEIVKIYLKNKYNKPGNVFLGVVHRIDRPTSGLVIFARTSKALARMNAMLQQHQVKKIYRAIVKKLPSPSQGTLIHYLIKNSKNNKSTAFDKPVNGSKKAVLHYNHIASSQRYHLLEIELETGRPHQIRVQLAKIGCPIKGDLKYGYPRSNPNSGISLHAWKLHFMHPVKKKPIELTASEPSEDIWEKFT